VGPCETALYDVSLPSLTHLTGIHGQRYDITFTATNNAGLPTDTVVNILVDVTPPSVGVVWEGLGDDEQSEMDFTDTHELPVRWHGFEDEESGVQMYRVALSERCLSTEEVEEQENVTVLQHPNQTAILVLPHAGNRRLWSLDRGFFPLICPPFCLFDCCTLLK
jgi:hypothetical protein